MRKITELASLQIKKITGGKDPIRLVEDLISKLGQDPQKCKREENSDLIRWLLDFDNEQELEILLDGYKKNTECTIYMGLNLLPISLRNPLEILATALEIADGLIGVKISLVGNTLVMSACLVVAGLNVDDLEFTFQLIKSQQEWFIKTLLEELEEGE